MFSFASTLCLIAGILVCLLGWRRRERANLPPGPRPIPLIGNLLDLTLKELWVRAASWSETYGDVVYLRIFGRGIMFLNSYDTATDLLEKRGAVYADRPLMVMCGELCGCENIMAFARYGNTFREYRRLARSALRPQNVQSYRPVIVAETRAFLERMIESPENYVEHIRRYTGGQILSIVYGYRVTADDDHQLKNAEEMLDLLSNRIASAGAGMWLVDVFPILKHLPAWLPGAGFKRQAAIWKAKVTEFADTPFEWAKQTLRENPEAHPSSYCATLLERVDPASSGKNSDTSAEANIKWTASTMYIASIDTIIVMLIQFILAMIKYPDALRTAQAEIDSVVGKHRLPTVDDRSALPYVNAVLSECMRWAAPVPLGLAHCVREHDEYEGMSVPEGTIVFANVWAMSRDPGLFADPDRFIPERYLEASDEATSKKRDPRNFIFGFGRRKCPGANLAEDILWVAMASMLAVFDFSKAVDASGDPVDPKPEYKDATFRLPTPFPCQIRPRSERVAQLVHNGAAAFAAAD